MMTHLPETPVSFPCGIEMKNRFMLAPMTNQQSHENGQLSEEEFHWLTLRAKGQFGLVMTCASHVQEIGKGFPGQLGIFGDQIMDGHKRLAKEIQAHGSLAVIQLHHAGMRSPKDVIGQQPVCPSDNEKTGARALRHQEVLQLRDDFIAAAVRAKACGYDGVEVHGAHGYLLTQFLSSEINKREDEYGGTLENRARILFEIIAGIREKCGDGFLLGVRLSPERFGMDLTEIKSLCEQLDRGRKVDFLDISLWNCFKMPEDESYQNKSLLDHFTHLPLQRAKMTVAGKIYSGSDVHEILHSGIDFVSIGHSGILHHDFPKQVMDNPHFQPKQTPVSAEYLKQEGLSEKFIEYMRRWDGFVST